MSPKFAKKLASKPNEIDILLCVATVIGSVNFSDVKKCALNVEGRILLTDLVQIEIQRCDIILGMDWLA